MELLKKNLLLGLELIILTALIVSAPSLHQKYLLHRARSQVFKLVNPSNHNSGGTGFTVKAASGKVYTLTNEHICAMTTDTYVDALVPGNEARTIRLKKIESSIFTDLCILEAMPNTDPLYVAGSLNVGEQVSVIGHPLLEPLTMIVGQVNNFQYINVAVGFDIDEQVCAARGGRTETLESIFSFFTTVCVRNIFSARTTLQTYPGNSGSPVLDVWGHLVGVLFAGNNQTNWGYIVPVSDVKQFLDLY